jgi:hypothetical protein
MQLMCSAPHPPLGPLGPAADERLLTGSFCCAPAEHHCSCLLHWWLHAALASGTTETGRLYAAVGPLKALDGPQLGVRAACCWPAASPRLF